MSTYSEKFLTVNMEGELEAYEVEGEVILNSGCIDCEGTCIFEGSVLMNNKTKLTVFICQITDLIRLIANGEVLDEDNVLKDWLLVSNIHTERTYMNRAMKAATTIN